MKTDKTEDTVDLGVQDLTISMPSMISIINFTDANDVAVAGVKRLALPRNSGAISHDILIDVAKGTSAFCRGGGSYNATLNLSGPFAFHYRLVLSAASKRNNKSGLLLLKSIG